jgi:hypothetical protein
MIRKIISSIIQLLPSDNQNHIRHKVQMATKDQTLKKWEASNKPVPPPHIVKQNIINDYQKKSKFSILVETGTYLGHMIDAQKNNFDLIYSIELSPKYWKKATRKFRSYNDKIKLVHGDSAKELPHVVSQLQKPAIFWLDGHYSLGTAMGDLHSPILNEIECILKSPIKNHILLIDDARDFVGKDGYPTLQELEDFIKERRPESSFEVKDDIIRILLAY